MCFSGTFTFDEREYRLGDVMNKTLNDLMDNAKKGSAGMEHIAYFTMLIQVEE